MKTRICVIMIITVIAASGFALGAEKAPTTKPVVLTTEMQKVSYSIGTIIGGQFNQQELDIQFPAFIQGLKDALGEKEFAIDKMEMQKIMMEFGQKMQKKMQEKQAKMMAERSKAAPVNAKKGADFLAANKKKKGVITTASGLQYKILKEGTGRKLKPTENFKAHYKGMFINGTVFDSSLDRGIPLDMRQTDVIQGWTEALKLMPIGSKWELYIPGDLAYGVRGKGDIGPNETLVFEMELLGAGKSSPPSMRPNVRPVQPK